MSSLDKLYFPACGMITKATCSASCFGIRPETGTRGKICALAQGTIARLTDRGFGFISQEGGEDLFFHSSALQSGTFDSLRRGDTVEFDKEQDTRGRGERAVNVRLVQR